MRKNSCIAVSFIILVMLSPLKDMVQYSAFYLNQSYIANTLCIQRNNPGNQCKGKCQLKKMMEQRQQQKDNCRLLEEFQFSIFHIENIIPFHITTSVIEQHKNKYWYNNKYQNPTMAIGAQPPEV